MSAIPFIDVWALADCAARILHEEAKRERSGDIDLDRKTRQILMDPAVKALRCLWKSGDASQRMAVACRVHVWLKGSVAPGFQQRLLEREKLREGKQ